MIEMKLISKDRKESLQPLQTALKTIVHGSCRVEPTSSMREDEGSLGVFFPRTQHSCESLLITQHRRSFTQLLPSVLHDDCSLVTNLFGGVEYEWSG